MKGKTYAFLFSGWLEGKTCSFKRKKTARYGMVSINGLSDIYANRLQDSVGT